MQDLVDRIQELLEQEGITCDPGIPTVVGEGPVKVVCVSGRLGSSVEALQAQARDQVVMVRIDQDTLEKLDAWVETGAAKSRSEAAALFIGEGLKLREAELEDLRAAIDRVRRAKDELRAAAARVLGGGENEDED